MKTDRHIYKRGAAPTLSVVLQHIFIAELLRPSASIWLISPWISDMEVVDNSTYGFQHMAPEWPLGGVRLSVVLGTLLQHQVDVHIVTRPLPPSYRQQEAHKVTHRFLQELQRQAPPAASPRIINDYDDTDEHSKGLLTEHTFLHGSMNFTYRGVHVNGEHVHLTRDPDEINEAYLACIDRWGLPVQ